MREITGIQQQPVPGYRGRYFPAPAVQTLPQLDFRFVLAAGFRTFERGFFQNLLRYRISLIAAKLLWFFPPLNSQLAG
jgi:hypothetical protein